MGIQPHNQLSWAIAFFMSFPNIDLSNNNAYHPTIEETGIDQSLPTSASGVESQGKISGGGGLLSNIGAYFKSFFETQPVRTALKNAVSAARDTIKNLLSFKMPSFTNKASSSISVDTGQSPLDGAVMKFGVTPIEHPQVKETSEKKNLVEEEPVNNEPANLKNDSLVSSFVSSFVSSVENRPKGMVTSGLKGLLNAAGLRTRGDSKRSNSESTKETVSTASLADATVPQVSLEEDPSAAVHEEQSDAAATELITSFQANRSFDLAKFMLATPQVISAKSDQGVHSVTVATYIDASPAVIAELLMNAAKYAPETISGCEKCQVEPLPNEGLPVTTRSQKETQTLLLVEGATVFGKKLPDLTLGITNKKTCTELPNKGGYLIETSLLEKNMAMKACTGKVQILPFAEGAMIHYEATVTPTMSALTLAKFQEGLTSTLTAMNRVAPSIELPAT